MTSTAAAITCAQVAKRFGSVAALEGFDLTVPEGTIMGLLGPSGSGKTTALRVIAGFEAPDEGTVSIDGRLVAGTGRFVPPEDRRVGMVFQDYALFPHLSVSQNISYGLPDRSEARVREMLSLVRLGDMADRMPHELSGGEQQRVALARALAPRPSVILLDEPFSNLDAPQRDRVRREVRTILIEARTTAVFVTHDQEEALAMSDVVAVMRDGRILQVARPDELYHQPADCWVARFLGEGAFMSGTVANGSVATPIGDFPVVTELSGDVEVMIRPEAVGLRRDDTGTATVREREFYGHDQLVTLELADGRTLLSRVGPNPIYVPGERVAIEVGEVVAFPPEAGHEH